MSFYHSQLQLIHNCITTSRGLSQMTKRMFFNSRDDVFSPTRPITTIYLKGYKEPRDYRSKKEEEKEGERVGGDNLRKRGSL